jgi:hypothetical protein
MVHGQRVAGAEAAERLARPRVPSDAGAQRRPVRLELQQDALGTGQRDAQDRLAAAGERDRELDPVSEPLPDARTHHALGEAQRLVRDDALGDPDEAIAGLAVADERVRGAQQAPPAAAHVDAQRAQADLDGDGAALQRPVLRRREDRGGHPDHLLAPAPRSAASSHQGHKLLARSSQPDPYAGKRCSRHLKRNDWEQR